RPPRPPLFPYTTLFRSGVAQAAPGLYDLAVSLGAPISLRALGLPEAALDRAADLAVAAPYPNPRPLERAALRALLQDAFDGRRPDRKSTRLNSSHLVIS